jgi:hypothetical protein
MLFAMITFLLLLPGYCRASGWTGGKQRAGEAIILSWNVSADILSIFALTGTIIF